MPDHIIMPDHMERGMPLVAFNECLDSDETVAALAQCANSHRREGTDSDLPCSSRCCVTLEL